MTQTSVYPREVVKRALQLNAGAVVLAHNHPSGAAEPSRADELITAFQNEGRRARLMAELQPGSDGATRATLVAAPTLLGIERGVDEAFGGFAGRRDHCDFDQYLVKIFSFFTEFFTFRL